VPPGIHSNSKVQREHGAASPRRATARVPTPLYTAPALTMITKRASPARSHCKGGGGVERGGDPCGRPDNAPHFWRPFSHVQVFSHCAEQRCLPSSALAIRSLCGFAEMWGIVRRSPWGMQCVRERERGSGCRLHSPQSLPPIWKDLPDSSIYNHILTSSLPINTCVFAMLKKMS